MLRVVRPATCCCLPFLDSGVEYSANFLQVAGTEQGVTEPEATFSACFGGAFLMLHPMKVRDAPTPQLCLSAAGFLD